MTRAPATCAWGRLARSPAIAAATLASACASSLPPLDVDHPRTAAVYDVAQLIETRHAEPFRNADADAFKARVDTLARRSPTLTDAEFKTELTRLAASLEDGHAYLNWTKLRATPLRFNLFSDGVFVTDAGDAHADLVGGRIERVGAVRVDKALERIRPLVSADNDVQRDMRAPIYLGVGEFQAGAGLGDGDSIELTMRFADGARRTVDVDNVDYAEYLRGLNIIPEPLQPYLSPDFSSALAFADMRPQSVDGPLYRRRHDASYWMLPWPEAEALYVSYRYVRQDAAPMPAFASEVERIARENPDWRVIVDVRENPGGSSENSLPLVAALSRLDLERKPGWLVVITGPKTFSAATGFLSWTEMQTGGLFVGGPSGGGPNHLGNVRGHLVDALGTDLKLSSAFNAWGLPADRRTTTRPHIAVEESGADFFAGADPLLDAALRASAADVGWVSTESAADIDRSYDFAPGQALRVRCARASCRVSITGLLNSPARAGPDGDLITWYRRIGVSQIGDTSAVFRFCGESRTLTRLSAAELPFEDLAARGMIDAARRRLAIEAAESPDAPRFSESRLNALGYGFLGRGASDAAIVVLEHVAMTHPASANARDSLGEAYLDAGDVERARESYEAALNLDPDLPSARRALENLQDLADDERSAVD